MEERFKEMQQRTNDLSDIVLEKDSKKTENTKKWLLTAASLILLFLIILIIMKMLNKPDEMGQENIATVGESVESLSPADIEDPTASVEENLFKKEPIIDESSDTDLKFEEMVRKLKEQDRVEEPAVEEVVALKEEAPVKKEPVAAKEVQAKEIKPVVEVAKKDPTPVKKSEVKKEPKPEAKPILSQFPETKIPSVSGYFIQVGATAKSFPDKRFLTKIKKAGFDYIVHGVNIKGKMIKKVLVGPYPTRDAAKGALASVKAKINPSAYIFRIK